MVYWRKRLARASLTHRWNGRSKREPFLGWNAASVVMGKSLTLMGATFLHALDQFLYIIDERTRMGALVPWEYFGHISYTLPILYVCVSSRRVLEDEWRKSRTTTCRIVSMGRAQWDTYLLLFYIREYTYSSIFTGGALFCSLRPCIQVCVWVCCSGGSAWENILRDLFGIRNRHSFNTLADPFAPIHCNNGTGPRG